MPIPQVTDRIKEAPAVVLRAVFAGIGQLLMAVDKIRAQTQEHAASSAPAGQNGTSPAQPANGTGTVTALRERPAPAAAHPATPADTAAGRPAATATKPVAPKPAAKQATSAKPAAAKAATTPKPAAAKPAAPPKPAAAKPAVATPRPAARPKPPAAEPTAKPAAAAPAAPIPGYDDLSVPSLRARLRGLDADGVRALLAYEKAHARRDDVITMFERRLAKLEDEAR